MTKISTKISALTGKLALIRHTGFNKKHLKATPKTPAKTVKRLESNGERWLHVLPETGESHLAISLYQFELERAKATAVA